MQGAALITILPSPLPKVINNVSRFDLGQL